MRSHELSNCLETPIVLHARLTNYYGVATCAKKEVFRVCSLNNTKPPLCFVHGDRKLYILPFCEFSLFIRFFFESAEDIRNWHHICKFRSQIVTPTAVQNWHSWSRVADHCHTAESLPVTLGSPLSMFCSYSSIVHTTWLQNGHGIPWR
jgi:hypothetical protein